MKLWREKNAIEMYSVHNKEKSVAAERFIRTLKDKIYQYMASISKNVYVDKLDDIINKYNNTYYRAIEINSIDVKSVIYNDFDKENNDEGPKFKVDDHVKMSKYKNTFAKGYASNWPEEVFVTKNV